MNASTSRLQIMVNYIILYVYIGFQTKAWMNFTNLKLNLEFIFNKNPYHTVVIGVFNAKSHNWYKGNKTIVSGSKLEIMTSHYGLNQIINESIDILD